MPIPRNAAQRAAPATGSGMKAPQAHVDPSLQRLTPQQQQMMMQQMYQQRYAQSNSRLGPQVRSRVRDRNAGVISEKEWEEAVVAHEESGRGFRKVLLVCLLFVLGLLAYFKWDTEMSVDLPPELQRLAAHDAEIRGEKLAEGERPAKVVQEPGAAEQLDKFYELLNVKGRIKATDEDEVEVASDMPEEEQTKTRAAADKQRRLDNWRVKKQLEKNFQEHNEAYGQLVTCGRTCESEHKQMQLAYETLNSKVDRELFGVLLDENVVQTGRRLADANELKSAYEKKKEEILTSEKEGSEEAEMQLAEIKDAYEILVNPEARSYYQLYGAKPPEYMKKTNAKHGGWGQDLLLRTHKNRLVLAWLEYLDAAWADYSVLCVIGFFGFMLPALVQLPRIIEMAQEIEARQVQMEELEKRAAAGN